MSDARFLITAYGTYLSHHHDRLRVLSQPDDTCKFHFEYHHHHIAIRTHHHHFVGVNHHHEAYVTNHHHDSQLFTIERVPDGRIALKSHAHHTFIGVDPYGYVKAHHHIDAGQLFTERPLVPGGVMGVVMNNPPLAAPMVAAQPPGVYTPAYGQPPVGYPGRPGGPVIPVGPPGVFTPATPVPVVTPVQPVYVQPTASVVYIEPGRHHHGHHHHHHHHHH